MAQLSDDPFDLVGTFTGSGGQAGFCDPFGTYTYHWFFEVTAP